MAKKIIKKSNKKITEEICKIDDPGLIRDQLLHINTQQLAAVMDILIKKKVITTQELEKQIKNNDKELAKLSKKNDKVREQIQQKDESNDRQYANYFG